MSLSVLSFPQDPQKEPKAKSGYSQKSVKDWDIDDVRALVWGSTVSSLWRMKLELGTSLTRTGLQGTGGIKSTTSFMGVRATPLNTSEPSKSSLSRNVSTNGKYAIVSDRLN